MSVSSSYFCTVRPAPGFILPESHSALEDFLLRHAKSAVVSLEKEGHATHVHFCFITTEPRRKDSVLRSVKTLISKFYLNAQVNLKIALTEGAYFYTIKDGNIIYRLNEADILGYIESDFERSKIVVEENTVYLQTVKHYSYSNRATWQPFFDNLKKKGRHMALEQWKTYVFIRLGQLAATEYMWELYYKQYINISNGVSQKVLETFKEFEEDDVASRRSSVSTEDGEPSQKKPRYSSSSGDSSDESCSDSDEEFDGY